MSPHGPMQGLGKIANNVLILTYTFNGTAAYRAQLELSADGSWLRGRWGSAVTGESGMAVMQRVT